MQLNGDASNLTKEQKDLLRLLVAKHESTGGAAFIFVLSSGGAAVCYPGGVSVSIPNDDTDFHQLHREDLITLNFVDSNQFRGKPTQRGITFVGKDSARSDDPSARQVATEPVAIVAQERTEEQSPAEAGDGLERDQGGSETALALYENRCPLLTQGVRERLRYCRKERETQLRRQIKLVEAQFRRRQEEIESVEDKEGAAEIALDQETTAIREEIVHKAMILADNGVREFANGLLVSQNRLGVHADLLRDYAARLVNEIRDSLSASRVFQIEPLLPWTKDPITQKAIQTCEEAIAERRKVGDRWTYRSVEMSGNNPTWPLVVQEWEAFKAANQIEPVPQERIPESVLRELLAGHYGIKPEDVDWEQIRQAGADLCRHYGRVLVIPLDLEINRAAKTAPASKATAQFWKEREDEFRAHDSPANCTLSATWFSIDEHWTFRSGPGQAGATAEALQVFKALAREAAKGLRGPHSPDLWLDWLDALRYSTDGSTGQRLYSKVSTIGSYGLPESDLKRMAKLSESVPRGGLIDFLVPPDLEDNVDQPHGPVVRSLPRAEKRMFWDTTTESIEFLFRASARFCLELRSLTPYMEETWAGPAASPSRGTADEAIDDQAESWHRLRRRFAEHVTDENEKLIAHFESTGDTWSFRGSRESERTFKALGREAGFCLTRETGLDAISHWLDALRTNQVAPVGPDSTTDPDTDGTWSRLTGPMPTAIDKLFSRSALFCLKWATEVSLRMKFFEQYTEKTPNEPLEADRADASEDETLTETTESSETGSWAQELFNPPILEFESAGTGNTEGPREQVDAFIDTVWSETSRRITRADFWRVAGYKEATQFERFQRNKNTSHGSVRKFINILKLRPAQFLERLDRLSAEE